MYGEGGMHIWFPLLPFEETSHRREEERNKTEGITTKRERSIEFDPEVFPVALFSQESMLVGLTQGVRHEPVIGSPQFLIHVKQQSSLHSLMLHLLENGRVDLALHLAAVHRSHSGFGLTLELLLHEVLDAEEFGYREETLVASVCMLRVALDFLKHFSLYPNIIINCARKVDVGVWPKLFSFAGNPRDLFHQCIVHPLTLQNLTAAAGYLRIIQLLESPLSALQMSAKLLDLVLKTKQYKLLPDLLRYINSKELLLGSSGDETKPDLTPQQQRQAAHIEATVMHSIQMHAAQLLSDVRLKELIRFSNITNVPLSECLKETLIPSSSLTLSSPPSSSSLTHSPLRKIDSSCNTEAKMWRAIRLLHKQFHIPIPERLPRSIIDDLCRLFGATQPPSSVSTVIFFPQSQTPLLEGQLAEIFQTMKMQSNVSPMRSVDDDRNQNEEDKDDDAGDRSGLLLSPKDVSIYPEVLDFVLKDLYTAKRLDWALLLSLLTLNIEVIFDILREQPPLIQPFISALSHAPGSVLSLSLSFFLSLFISGFSLSDQTQ